MENQLDLLRGLSELTARVRELEDIERIKELQLRYWRAVDQKNPEMLRSVFSPGKIHIEFEGMQTWTSRDEFVQTFIELGMDAARQENHCYLYRGLTQPAGCVPGYLRSRLLQANLDETPIAR